jgi:hypothetical protein
MAADVIQTTILTAHMRESVVLMDDYGTVHRLYINISQANRGNLIAGAQAEMNARQTALEAYAAATGNDLKGQKLASIAAKQAKFAAQMTKRSSSLAKQTKR